MLRASGFDIERRVEEDVYICRRRTDVPYAQWQAGAVYPAKGPGA